MAGLICYGNSHLPVAVLFLKTGIPHTQSGKWCGNSKGKSKGKQQGKGDLHRVSDLRLHLSGTRFIISVWKTLRSDCLFATFRVEPSLRGKFTLL